MRWLVHGAKLSPAVAEALVRHEDQAQTIADLGIAPESSNEEILKVAQAKQLDILTTDAALANAPYELDYYFKRSIVFLQLEGGDVEQDDAVDRLFARYKRLTPGRLYTVTSTRVKVRQLPGSQL